MKAKDWRRRRGELLRVGSKKKKKSVWRQTKDIDVEKLFFYFIFFSKIPGYLEKTELRCVCISSLSKLWENQEQLSLVTCSRKSCRKFFSVFRNCQISQSSHGSQYATY